MKCRFAILFNFLSVISLTLFGEIIDVPDDYTSIQSGLNVADSSDTVLVKPGTYQENISWPDTNGIKLISSDNKDNTFLDGGNQRSVISVEYRKAYIDTTTLIKGFTIKNGSGTKENQWDDSKGGGIYIKSTSPLIKNINIINNSAYNGAGIYLSNSNSSLINITIKNNDSEGISSEDSDLLISNFTITNNKKPGFKCYRTDALLQNGVISKNGFQNYWGGGIWCSHNSNVTLSGVTLKENKAIREGGGIWNYKSSIKFSSKNLCNIYMNHSPKGSDIASYEAGITNVIVDTFTVIDPTRYYAYPLDEFNFDIQNAKLDNRESDLYVAPDGDNSNSGLTEEHPLRTINYALNIIRADSSNPHNIYLTEGIYSSQTNGEIYPLALKSYVSLIGENQETTILDGNDEHQVIHCDNIDSLHIKNLTVQNGNNDTGGGCQGGGIGIIQSSILLENIEVTQNHAGIGGGLFIYYNSRPVLNNITISNNTSGAGGGLYIRSSCPKLDNVIIYDNIAERGGGICCDYLSDPQIDNSSILNNTAKNRGGGLYVERSSLQIKNNIIENNISEHNGAGIYCQKTELDLDSVTIRNNTANRKGGGIFAGNSEIKLTGSKIADNIAGKDSYFSSSYLNGGGGGIYNKSSSFNFDTDNKCNIYDNKAKYANDIYSDTLMPFQMDTFTVIKPTNYHIFPFDSFSYKINTGKLNQVSGNVYVSPDGNNSNSGLDESNPLATIDNALSRIYADSLDPGIIHLVIPTKVKPSFQKHY